MKFLSKNNILAIHSRSVELFGGTRGVRDIGLVESAAARPQCGYYSGVEACACALFESLLIDHPFLDGNKRTAFGAFHSFLKINGKELMAHPKDMYNLIIKWIETDPDKRLRTMTKDIYPYIA